VKTAASIVVEHGEVINIGYVMTLLETSLNYADVLESLLLKVNNKELQYSFVVVCHKKVTLSLSVSFEFLSKFGGKCFQSNQAYMVDILVAE
jgi:hypothetical protein